LAKFGFGMSVDGRICGINVLYYFRDSPDVTLLLTHPSGRHCDQKYGISRLIYLSFLVIVPCIFVQECPI
jgi:hypothetical protein